MPAVEARHAFRLVLLCKMALMEGPMRGMFELRFRNALMIVDGSVADELYLGDPRDSLEVWMKDRLLGLPCLIISVPVALA